MIKFLDWCIRVFQSISIRTRLRWAMALFIISVVAWPLTAPTIFLKEDQGILGLSYLAFQASMLTIVLTTDVRDNEEGGD